MTTHEKHLNCWTERLQKVVNNIPQVGTSAVLATKQEPQKLVMPAQVGCTESSRNCLPAVQRSLEASVYGGIAVDESQLWGVSPHQSLSPTLAPGTSSNPSNSRNTQ